ncbi:hypothetical protein [Sinorhizobium meliloti]|uniref:hypothetical protein n=1 Tax=Rhizobium meliloti TaxID=382 RepID=UPI00040B055F|nr:hypothetical protein [Sinorhizobium meliloti]
MDYLLTGIWGSSANQSRVEEGLAVVDALRDIQCDKDILINVAGIGTGRLDITSIDLDLLRPGAQERLARDKLKNPLKLFIC